MPFDSSDADQWAFNQLNKFSFQLILSILICDAEGVIVLGTGMIAENVGLHHNPLYAGHLVVTLTKEHKNIRIRIEATGRNIL